MKKVLSLLLTLAIIISLVPAYKVEAKSKMITMYVITSEDKGGNNQGVDVSYGKRYEYNKNGLVEKEIGGTSASPIIISYKYKGSRIVEYDNKTKVSYNKKKRLVKIVYNWGEQYSYSYKYYLNRKGKIKKVVYDDGTYSKYTYSKGKEKQSQYDQNGKYTDGYRVITYNSHGHYKSVENYPSGHVNMVNVGDFYMKYKYNKKGYAVKKTEKKDGDVSYFVTNYKYKKIRVPASYKKAIKKQQRSIINHGNAFIWSGAF